MVERFPVTLDDLAYGWRYVCDVLINSHPGEDPSDPTAFMIFKITHYLREFNYDGPMHFSEVEMFAIIWVLRRWQKWITDQDEAAECRLLYNSLRKQLCEHQSTSPRPASNSTSPTSMSSISSIWPTTDRREWAKRNLCP